MKRNEIRNILLVFTLLSNAAYCAQMDIFADVPVVKHKPRVVAPAAAKPAPAPKAVVKAPAATTQWIQTMEASLSPLSSKGDPTAFTVPLSQIALTWMGWALATLFGGVLLLQGLTNRRKQHNLLRAGDRDSFLLPPSHRRRRF